MIDLSLASGFWHVFALPIGIVIGFIICGIVRGGAFTRRHW